MITNLILYNFLKIQENTTHRMWKNHQKSNFLRFVTLEITNYIQALFFTQKRKPYLFRFLTIFQKLSVTFICSWNCKTMIMSVIFQKSNIRCINEVFSLRRKAGFKYNLKFRALRNTKSNFWQFFENSRKHCLLW